MGSKDGSQQQEVPTPEAARPPPPPAALPGSESVTRESKKGSSLSPRPEEGKDAKANNWWRWGTFLYFAPLWAVLAGALLILGLVGFAIHGKDVGDLSLELCELVGSTDSGMPRLVRAYTAAYPATVTLASVTLAASIFLAAVRVNQKLRRAGKTKGQGAYQKQTFNILHWVSIVLLVFACLTFIWFLLNFLLLASWGLGLWAVRDGSEMSVASFQQIEDSSNQYLTVLTNFANALDSRVSMLTMKQPTLASRFNTTIAKRIARMEAYTPMLIPGGDAELLEGGLVPAQNSLCPSVACLNMALYSFLESSYCVCTQQLIASTNEVADDAVTEALWSIGSLACLVLGSWIVTMQFIAGINLMATDQLWLRVVRKRSSSRNSTTPPSRRSSRGDRGQRDGGERLKSGSTFIIDSDKKQFMAEAQRLASAARRLPYSSPPAYDIKTDARNSK